MCWRLLFGSSSSWFCVQEKHSRKMESQHEKKKFPLQKQGLQCREEKPIHDEVFSEKYLDISGAVWTLRKMPSLEDRAEHQRGAERKREEWPHLDKSPPRNYLCLYCQSWPDISTADAIAKLYATHPSCFKKSSSWQRHLPKYWFFHAWLISAPTPNLSFWNQTSPNFFVFLLIFQWIKRRIFFKSNLR